MMIFHLMKYSDAYSLVEIVFDITKNCLIC